MNVLLAWMQNAGTAELSFNGHAMQALKTTYHTTRQYMEIDIDVSANSTAAYITGMVRGATSGLVIDLGEATLTDV